MQSVSSLYQMSRPLYFESPHLSCLVIFDYDEWKDLPTKEKHRHLASKNVIVTDWPIDDPISFNEKGLRAIAGNFHRQISIQGMCCPSLILFFHL